METIDVVPLDASGENVTTTVEVEPPKRGRSRQPKQDEDVKPKRQTRQPTSPLPLEPTPTSEMPEVTGISSVSEVQEEQVPLDEPVPSPDVEAQSLPPAVESKPKKTRTIRLKLKSRQLMSHRLTRFTINQSNIHLQIPTFLLTTC
jgi:hypothetical protein